MSDRSGEVWHNDATDETFLLLRPDPSLLRSVRSDPFLLLRSDPAFAEAVLYRALDLRDATLVTFDLGFVESEHGFWKRLA